MLRIRLRDVILSIVGVVLLLIPRRRHSPEKETQGDKSKLPIWRGESMVAFAVIIVAFVVLALAEAPPYFPLIAKPVALSTEWLIRAAAVLVTFTLVAAGLLLWIRERHSPGSKSELGAALVSGALVAFAFFSFQTATDQQDRRRDEENQRRADRESLQLTLGLNRDLSGIDLAKRDCSGFFLRGKIFADANLSSANFRNANLGEGDFTDGADDDSIGANLRNADLRGADLSGANLQTAIVEGALFEGALASELTRWPPGFDPIAANLRFKSNPK